MTTTTHTHTDTEELAYRSSDGVEVSLYWNRLTNLVTLVVSDAGSGDAFAIIVPRENALDAFYHPYAYAAHTGVEYRAGDREPVHA